MIFRVMLCCALVVLFVVGHPLFSFPLLTAALVASAAEDG